MGKVSLNLNLVDNKIHHEPNVSAVLFDLDGTLISTLDLHIESFQWILNKLGKVIDREELEKLMGLTPQEIIRHFLTGIDPETLWDASQEKENYLETLITHVNPFPGVIDLLKALYELGIKTAVISSTHLKLVKVLLSSAGLLDYFDSIVSGDEISFGKPHPEPFTLGIRKLGLKPEVAIGIGDSIYDAESCLAAGIRFIGVLTGKTSLEAFMRFNNISLINSMQDISI